MAADYHESTVTRILIWLILGLTGGVVHTCENKEHTTLKHNVASLLTSGFAGMVGGMLFHSVFEDPMMLGGACAMMGYMGQVSLILLKKWVSKNINGGQ